MNSRINGKHVFYSSIFIFGYFAFLFYNGYVLKSENIVIGFVQELWTIPLLGIQFLLLLFVLKRLVTRKEFSANKYSFWAFLILVITNSITLVSLIFGIG